MKQWFLSAFVVFCVILNTQAQTQSPGLDVLGYGYDIFGSYADQKSKKRYCLFEFSNYRETPIGSYRYSVPQYVFLENISHHIVKTVSGESIRDYARSLSTAAGLEVDAKVFSASVDATFDQSTVGTEQKFYYTYMDANTKWRISFDERNLSSLKNILDPQFKNDLATMDPDRLFELYGTHYIASAYLGGRADYTTETTISSETNTTELSLALEAKYKVVSANASMSKKDEQTLSKVQTKSKLSVVGGNSQYANNINNWEAYKLWADGIETMPVLCDFDKNSLKPIWDFCESPTRKAELQAAFVALCAKYPLPAALANLGSLTNNAYMIRNKSNQATYWDFAGFNTQAAQKGGKLQIAPKDGNSHRGQGFDRVFRIQPNELTPQWVSFMPQHCNLTLDVSGNGLAGSKIELADFDRNKTAQLFTMEPVDGEANTYYIKHKSGLYIELPSANLNTELILNKYSGQDNQKWFFETFNPINIAQPENGYYIIYFPESNKYWDFPGTYPAVRENLLQIWSPGSALGDRTYEVTKTGDLFTIRPDHHNSFLLTGSSNERLTTAAATRADNQLFSFEYGGQPNSYVIVHKATNQAIAANASNIREDGCIVKLENKTGFNNQRWELKAFNRRLPIHEGTYHIKIDASNKYLDLGGDENASNRDGANAQIWDMDGGKDRILKFLPTNHPLYYRVQFQNGGRFLDVGGAWNLTDMSIMEQANWRKWKQAGGSRPDRLRKVDEGANIQAWSATNRDNQEWEIRPVDNNCFILVNRHSDKAFQVQGNRINDNGTSIHQWFIDNKSAGQRMKIINTSTKQEFGK